MFCEHCGCSLEQDAKFCTGCGTPTINESKQLVAEMSETEEAWTCEIHREYFWEYFIKGILGFVIGSVLAFVMGSPEGFVVLGLAFAGVPYGWNLITRITGGWTLYGIVIICLYYMLKLFLSLLIGFTVYPPLLFYHLMMSQKPKSVAQTICLVIFVLSIMASFLVIFGFVAKG